MKNKINRMKLNVKPTKKKLTNKSKKKKIYE